jgi:hypothetical protein
MIHAWLALLDAYGMNDPDNNEGFTEHRCNVCEWPTSDDVGRDGTDRAKWQHRRAVIRGLIAGALPSSGGAPS